MALKELVNHKMIPEPMLLDLAYFRLKFLLKIEPTELDLILMKEALKMADKTSTQGEIISGSRYGMIKSEFI